MYLYVWPDDLRGLHQNDERVFLVQRLSRHDQNYRQAGIIQDPKLASIFIMIDFFPLMSSTKEGI